MPTSLEVLLAPAELTGLPQRDLRETVCVVFDILRATSTMMTALANGAREIVPVAEIDEALAMRRKNPDALLAGERHGLRILANQTGSIDFDLGNSPREFTQERVAGKCVVMTTTNGTRALSACASAKTVLLGSFLGLQAAANWIRDVQPRDLLFVCSGTIDQVSFEDALGAGALADLIWPHYIAGNVTDSAQICRQIYQMAKSYLLGAMQSARNGRRLLSNPDLRADVAFSLQLDRVTFLARLMDDGRIRKWG